MQSTDLSQPADLAPQPWYRVWIHALTRPNTNAYESLVSRPKVTLFRASLWMFMSTVIAYGSVMTFITAMSRATMSSTTASADWPMYVRYPLLLLLYIPGVALGPVLTLLAYAGISHLSARFLGGVGTYTQLAYALSAYMSPLTIGTMVISIIPILNCTMPALAVYSWFLNVLSIKAVHRFTWARAIVAWIAPVAAFLLLGTVPIAFLSLLAPQIGAVFSNIIAGFPTPTPIP
jgi:hypothetical protein